MRFSLPTRCLFLISSLLIFSVISFSSQAQTTTTYTYDGQGRMIYADPSTNEFLQVSYDDANNITEIISNDTTAPPVNESPICENITVLVPLYTTSHTMDGLSQCSEPEGEDMTLISVTDPLSGATATIGSNNQIIFQNIGCGWHETTRHVVDINGNGTSTTVNVTSGPCVPTWGPEDWIWPPY